MKIYIFAILLVFIAVVSAFATKGDTPNQQVLKFGTIANSTAITCTKGEIRTDATYLYSCYSSNKWKRLSNGATF